MKIIVQLDDGQMFETVAKSSDTLDAVKEAVERQTQVPANKQKLYFGGSELKHGETLAHCLWESLKKVSTKDASGSKIDLRTVKMLCSPAGSPNRALSPTRSSTNMDAMLRNCSAGKGGDSVTGSTLEEAAQRLSHEGLGDSRQRSVSPERRAAAERLLASRGGGGSPDGAMSPISSRAEGVDNPLGFSGGGDVEQNPEGGSPNAGASPGKGSPRPGDPGFSGYSDDMIL
mmetsp:Transcript_29305/g.73641  ORF Transcript_29305/g.73641 Transcript_29305/m.73641 type:complete len:230 (-) Transcript_29305:70-759(-)|eukprot:CAMPEP_0173420742 /NCGR_PEP_ID=MMETSP1357-20121228/2099_1 /TAXON_ID=77926 /ORGANISM="Hemiselmis rufescens, Strain PCC563" /LENGTH=229 /DNA_ID=CAMNT_0014383561 /DNA_START=239 /DNA_END=928 /DNA_ORIENTATION=+